MDQVVIVGAGQAGSCAAFAMRRAGMTAPVTIVGEEPERPYERPPLSKEVLTAETPSCPFLAPAERYSDQDITLKLARRVESIDTRAARVHLSGGETLAYDRLLLATGGRPRRLGVPGAALVRYLRSFGEATALREALRGARHVACIGAGVVGLEVAASARALGREVTVIEAAGSVMGRCLAGEDASFVEDLHRKAGVDLRLRQSVAAVEETARGMLRVVATDGTAVDAHCLVAGIGMERDVELAAAAGIAVDNGIVVDDRGRTSAEGVFAAGDVAAFWHPLLERRLRLESWHHAQNHGVLVGRVMAGADARYEDVPRFWTDQHGVNIQVAGFPAEGVGVVLAGSRETSSYTAFHLDAGNRVVGVTAVNRPRDMKLGIDLIRSGRAVEVDELVASQRPVRRTA